MINYTAYFHPQQFKRIIRALYKLEDTIDRLEDELPRLQAMDYAHLLQNNILSGKHMSGYPAYHLRYEEWKDQYATYRGFWQAMGHLVNNVTYWKERKGDWRSGIPAGVMDAGGTSWFGQGDRGPSKPIAMYAKTMEFGEGHNVKRPIFVPTLEEYKEAGFRRRGEWAFRQLRGQWS